MSITPFQSEGLRLLGYSERESEFLFLVATHSGYFTTQQFKNFLQTESGSVSHAFTRRLLEQKHATYRAYRSGERVYHLFARKVYQAIERENLRTRKKHELEYVKTRLVALDFVLAHPQHRYLETEPEKIHFFEKERGLDRDFLPVKLYRARKSAEVTPRYFVDRFPLFVNPAIGRLTFTYIDPGLISLDGFATHLRAYSPLFQNLSAFDFIYISPMGRFFQDAQSEFFRTVSGHASQGKSVSVLDYFRLRKAWDAKERVASADVVLLKEAQAFYPGKLFEDLYVRWRNETITDGEVVRSGPLYKDTSRGTFRTFLCGASLKVFRDPLANSTEIVRNAGINDSSQQTSGPSSIQGSGP